MPGPGGGAHGGGFGGGSRGGGFTGGGGMRAGIGPRRYGFYRYRRGCFGGILNLILLPIIMLIIFIYILLGNIGGMFGMGGVSYNEEKLQKYADEQYAAEFSKGETYEDNLLIVFLTNKKSDGYYCIAWVGDNIDSRISNMFGDEYTEFGATVNSSVNDSYYAYSLDKNLASVMDTMGDKIVSLGLGSSFYTEHEHYASSSHLTNKTDLSLSEETVNRSLEEFTKKTGIPAVIVVDSMEEVLGGVTLSAIIAGLLSIALIVVIIVLIVRKRRCRPSLKL